ncbi:MAG: VWA domain-containing protein [Planctomycetes bacterium]|nr:VWA domain-containing protein [Planctomycetota bacterium]
MEWPDWNSLQIAKPEVLPWVGVALLLGVASLVLPWRHSRRTVAVAGLLRALVIGVLVFAIAGFVTVGETEQRYEPAGTWRLVLDGAQPPKGDAQDFSESPNAFVNRLRNALAGETPPAQTEVWGTRREDTLAARDAVQALGVPCTPHFPVEEQPASRPVLTGIDAPRQVQPGEPLVAKFTQAGPPAEMRAYLDGKPLKLKDGQAEVRSDQPGRHVLESVLSDAQGNELQRTGQVFRVGDKPSVLAVGLGPEQLQRAIAMAPEMDFASAMAEQFGEASLQRGGHAVDLVLISVDGLNKLNSDQCFSLAGFVARGGGLFVTGDGAKYVAPEYLPTDARNLLPVILRKEGKKPPPDDPPVDEKAGKAEVAKVSICFVLDRSYSMTQTIGNTTTTRWKVATTGVAKSIKLVEEGGRRETADKHSESYATRIGVLAFTLKQNWVYEMNTAFPYDRGQIVKQLDRMGEELTQIDPAEFDEQGYNTDIYAATKAAIEVMKEEKSAVKVIVMLTDGSDRDANTTAGLKHSDLKADAIANNINIVTVGIGEEFDGSTPRSRSALKVVRELATRNEYVHVAANAANALKADVIFVDSVEMAFEAYDDKKKEEDAERKRRLEEQKNKEKEPPKVDVLPGTFPLQLGPMGDQLFGADAIPEDAPKVAWVARNDARDGAAVALTVVTDEDGPTPTLAFQGYGLGRVAFWGAGTEPKALGELTGWADFPAIFAASLRWLLPREEPDVRLLAEAGPGGIRILDPIEGADYSLRTPDGDVPLKLKDGRLSSEADLPLGAGEVIETIGGTEPVSRSIGDVYVAEVPAIDSRQFAVDDAAQLAPLKPRPPEVTAFTREAILPVLYLLTLFMLVLPIERLIRRRS